MCASDSCFRPANACMIIAHLHVVHVCTGIYTKRYTFIEKGWISSNIAPRRILQLDRTQIAIPAVMMFGVDPEGYKSSHWNHAHVIQHSFPWLKESSLPLDLYRSGVCYRLVHRSSANEEGIHFMLSSITFGNQHVKIHSHFPQCFRFEYEYNVVVPVYVLSRRRLRELRM